MCFSHRLTRYYIEKKIIVIIQSAGSSCLIIMNLHNNVSFYVFYTYISSIAAASLLLSLSVRNAMTFEIEFTRGE